MANPKNALMFSGGRDSLVMLDILKEQLDDIYVIWIDTGASYGDVVEQMERVRASVPHFIRWKSDQPGNIREYGYPVDLLPIRMSAQGLFFAKKENPPLKLQSAYACCYVNIWLPMGDAVRHLGVERVILGQREGEGLTDRWDRVENGVEYWYPLKSWTTARVMGYLTRKGIPIPAYYQQEDHSRDCVDCTAYLKEKRKSIANLPEPTKAEVVRRLKLISAACHDESMEIEYAILGGLRIEP